MYALVAEGTIALSTRDQCKITITGNLYPWFYEDTGIDGALFIGTATTHDGTGKLGGFDREFEVYSWCSSYCPGINLAIGEFNLVIRE